MTSPEGRDHDDERQRYGFMRNLTDDQIDLYYRMLDDVTAGHGTYWECLDRLDAPAANKYALTVGLDGHDRTATARQYAAQAGIDRTHTHLTDGFRQVTTREAAMSDLRVGDRFVGPDGHTVYEVIPKEGHQVVDGDGSLWVRNLSMTGKEAERRSRYPEEEGLDPRVGFFSYPPSTLLDRIVPTQPADPSTGATVPTASADAGESSTTPADLAGLAAYLDTGVEAAARLDARASRLAEFATSNLRLTPRLTAALWEAENACSLAAEAVADLPAALRVDLDV